MDMKPSLAAKWFRPDAGFLVLFLMIVGVDYFATGRWSATTLAMAVVLSILARLIIGVAIWVLLKVASTGRPR